MKFVATFLFILGVVARTDPGEPRIQATLSNDHTTVGQPVRLEVEVRNARDAEPPNISVDGLSVRFTSQSKRIQALNGDISSAVNFTYLVTPEREGEFSIPSIKLNIAGKEVQTSPLTLTATKEAKSKAEPNKSYFGELVVPKESAYVGEAIPVELRYYFDRRIWYQPYPQGQLPIIDGDGFVTAKYPDPAEKEVQIDGHWYRVLIYKTAITGVRAGKLDLRTATQEFLLHVPILRNVPPSLDNDFDQSPFSNGFSGYERKDVSVGTNGITLEVKALPTEGRPANFSGAVGRFSMTGSVQPSQAKVGDPIDLQIQISGNGNFDRVQAPALSTAPNWRVHQVSSETQAQDDIGLNAIKTFRYPLVADRPARETPGASFSYFDPERAQYISLSVDPQSVSVNGQPIGQPSPQPTTAGKEGAPAPSPSSALIDFVATTRTNSAFQPLRGNSLFWVIQLLPAGILVGLGFTYWNSERARRREPLRALLADRRTQRRKLNSSRAEDVLSAAVRLIELDQLVRAKGRLRHITPEDALRQKEMPEDLHRALTRVIEQRADCVYAHRPQVLSPDELTEIKSLIEAWEKAPQSNS